MQRLTLLSNSEKTIPTTIEFVDIAGLVKGASQGEGLGNKFLSHIREVDAIIEVVRHFEDKNVIHVVGEINPESDKETIDTELALADLETVEKRKQRMESEMKGNKNDQLQKTAEALDKVYQLLSQGQPARRAELNEEERKLLRDLSLLTLKPLLYVNNVDEQELAIVPETKNSINICAKLEADLSDLPTNEVKEYLAAAGIRATGLDKLIVAGYDLLNLITFLTTGPKETKAWTIKKGSCAPAAAGVIHTDFEKGFIRAEVISYQDFITADGELGAKEKGLLRVEGKDYVMQDGDVCHFRFSV